MISIRWLESIHMGGVEKASDSTACAFPEDSIELPDDYPVQMPQ